ncbi:MAG: hypothetical protein MRY64_16220, partial [Hyphomonadaceae bacterium]|nr:hypothetical protein [Hyphomonadaceae bacterium]
GVRLFQEAALRCVLRQALAGRDWDALSQAEQLAVAPVLARLYLATRDESVRQYDFCTHKPGALAEAIVNTFVEAMSMESAPAPYRLEKPGAGTEHMDILRSYLYCESEAERAVTDLPVGDAGPDLSKPRPDQDEALKLYQAWSGVCDMDDPEIRDQVETGAQLAWPEALECVFSHQLSGRSWPDLSDKERGDLLDEVIALSLLTKDPDILALEVCDLAPDIRWAASQIVFEQFREAYARPPDRRPPVPFGFAIPLHQRIDC